MTPRLFQQRNWFLNLHHWCGLIGAGVALWWVFSGALSVWWLLLWFIMHNLIVIGASAGYHRLYTHNAFRTNKFWHVILSLFGALSGTGSAIQWRVLHTEHHLHSDTLNDPHISDWPYLLWKTYRNVKLNPRRSARLTRDKFQMFMHNYYMLVVVAIGALMFLISPLVFVFGFLAPVGTVGLGGGIHNIISHWGKKPHDLAILEYLYPFGGEWLHRRHHEAAKVWNLRTKWWHLDTSALLIKLIKT